MARNNKQLKQYKKDVAKMTKLVLWAIPLIFVLSVTLTLLHFEYWLIILINLVAGGAFCFLVYVISDKIKEKKQLKEELEPKKFDPFSD